MGTGVAESVILKAFLLVESGGVLPLVVGHLTMDSPACVDVECLEVASIEAGPDNILVSVSELVRGVSLDLLGQGEDHVVLAVIVFEQVPFAKELSLSDLLVVFVVDVDTLGFDDLASVGGGCEGSQRTELEHCRFKNEL